MDSIPTLRVLLVVVGITIANWLFVTQVTGVAYVDAAAVIDYSPSTITPSR